MAKKKATNETKRRDRVQIVTVEKVRADRERILKWLAKILAAVDDLEEDGLTEFEMDGSQQLRLAEAQCIKFFGNVQKYGHRALAQRQIEAGDEADE